MALPLLWMVATSLKAPGSVVTYPPEFLPRGLHPENYPAAWNAVQLQRGWLNFDLPYQFRVSLGGWSRVVGPWSWAGVPIRNAFLVWYLNTLMVAFAVTLGTLVTSALAAFAFARLEFPGRNVIFLTYLATLMVPYVVTMIPIFMLLTALHLVDTYFALIVPVMFSAYGTFLLRQFFLAIPHDLEDAARLDGCGNLGVLRHVILPLSKPALATLGTFTFLGTWNSFMWPLIVINYPERAPLMLGLYSFMGEYTAQWQLLMAASVMVMAPVVVVFILGQRYFIEGIVLSGMKG
jgi:multiple sugar transport system permease protein